MSFDHGSAQGAPLRFAVVGVGERGSVYARALLQRGVEGAVLAAVCDSDPSRLEAFEPALRAADPSAVEALGADVWVVATPPEEHPSVLQRAFAARAHVLAEKPLATTAVAARGVLDDHARLAPDRVLSVALPLRSDPRYVTLRALLRDGTLGDPCRVSWTITDCLRTDAYYRARPWRAREGGGGGVLMNQCLHQLDLLIWLFGMPRHVRADVGIGRHHPIEVEDDVTAFFELAGGARGVLVASTGESPGCNRLEVVGTKARVVIDGGLLTLTRNARPTTDELRHGPVRSPTRVPVVERRELSTGGASPAALLSALSTAVRRGSSTTADAAAGVACVELAEAMLLSGAEGRTHTIPHEELSDVPGERARTAAKRR